MNSSSAPGTSQQQQTLPDSTSSTTTTGNNSNTRTTRHGGRVTSAAAKARRRKDSRLARLAKKATQTVEEIQKQRSVANVRERQRTLLLNEGFVKLRRIIPTMPSDKMSKIHTLRLATMYIDFLDKISDNNIQDAQLNEATTLEQVRDRLAVLFSAYRMEIGASQHAHYWYPIIQPPQLQQPTAFADSAVDQPQNWIGCVTTQTWNGGGGH